MKDLFRVKKGDIVNFKFNNVVTPVIVVRETVAQLDCDVSKVKELDQNIMSFSRKYGLQKGAFRKKNFTAPRIEVIG